MNRRVTLGALAAAVGVGYYMTRHNRQASSRLEQKNAEIVRAVENEGQRFDKAVGETTEKAKSYLQSGKERVVDELDKPRENVKNVLSEAQAKGTEQAEALKKGTSKWF
ncbi:Schizosaccharomyces specific protein [Schizosaccharomyces pombe]|uniref:Uncharacterized protein C1393.12 n=1 Tax=Schizosaccharomyces pombe (strain 972 / ATCC 24843) TaxID=284812 RepID=YCFC_SCHPO|nr:uncharacterized protein SPCC1393.12 [Schizosaccharomyces pombe]O94724.1 RecName: Full=Uncharacterized protein C1393.12 [Schizosaccharomyces pombe 972h-]CAB38167.1 sequence orphan [Schizosaccharomyces pombe]|eukprot:NP_587970.1 uncharacterized protein SPCC1393.12 [Schizosaccharomyces pombe]